MTITVAIPQTTLQVGARQFGPVPYTSTTTNPTAEILLDRTVAGGLDSVPQCVLNLKIEVSADGGATFHHVADALIPGGVQRGSKNDDGTFARATTADVTVALPTGTNWVRGTVTVQNQPVTVVGSLTVNT